MIRDCFQSHTVANLAVLGIYDEVHMRAAAMEKIYNILN